MDSYKKDEYLKIKIFLFKLFIFILFITFICIFLLGTLNPYVIYKKLKYEYKMFSHFFNIKINNYTEEL